MTIRNSSKIYNSEARSADVSPALQLGAKQTPAIVVPLDDFDTPEDVEEK